MKEQHTTKALPAELQSVPTLTSKASTATAGNVIAEHISRPEACVPLSAREDVAVKSKAGVACPDQKKATSLVPDISIKSTREYAADLTEGLIDMSITDKSPSEVGTPATALVFAYKTLTPLVPSLPRLPKVAATLLSVHC